MKRKKEGGKKKGKEGRKMERGKRKGERERKKKQSSTAGLEPATFHSPVNGDELRVASLAALAHPTRKMLEH